MSSGGMHCISFLLIFLVCGFSVWHELLSFPCCCRFRLVAIIRFCLDMFFCVLCWRIKAALPINPALPFPLCAFDCLSTLPIASCRDVNVMQESPAALQACCFPGWLSDSLAYRKCVETKSFQVSMQKNIFRLPHGRAFALQAGSPTPLKYRICNGINGVPPFEKMSQASQECLTQNVYEQYNTPKTQMYPEYPHNIINE